MSPATIGVLLGASGLINGIVQGVFFAKLIRRVGLKRLFLIGLFCYVPIFATFPVISHLMPEWGLSPVVWILVIFQLVISCVAGMCNGRCSSLNAFDVIHIAPVAYIQVARSYT